MLWVSLSDFWVGGLTVYVTHFLIIIYLYATIYFQSKSGVFSSYVNNDYNLCGVILGILSTCCSPLQHMYELCSGASLSDVICNLHINEIIVIIHTCAHFQVLPLTGWMSFSFRIWGGCNLLVLLIYDLRCTKVYLQLCLVLLVLNGGALMR